MLNPRNFFDSGTPGNLEEFLHRAYHYVHARCSLIPGSERNAAIYWVYMLGRDLQLLECSYSELEYWLDGRGSSYYYYRSHKFNPRWFYELHGVAYRERQSGPRNVSDPQELDAREIHRREWRARKGFSRDHGKCYGRGRYKQWAKRQSNRIHRGWERQMIHNEAWDDTIGDYTKYTHDPWMWD